jgi:hypothetical protein
MSQKYSLKVRVQTPVVCNSDIHEKVPIVAAAANKYSVSDAI